MCLATKIIHSMCSASGLSYRLHSTCRINGLSDWFVAAAHNSYQQLSESQIYGASTSGLSVAAPCVHARGSLDVMIHGSARHLKVWRLWFVSVVETLVTNWPRPSAPLKQPSAGLHSIRQVAELLRCTLLLACCCFPPVECQQRGWWQTRCSSNHRGHLFDRFNQ